MAGAAIKSKAGRGVRDPESSQDRPGGRCGPRRSRAAPLSSAGSGADTRAAGRERLKVGLPDLWFLREAGRVAVRPSGGAVTLASEHSLWPGFLLTPHAPPSILLLQRRATARVTNPQVFISARVFSSLLHVPMICPQQTSRTDPSATLAPLHLSVVPLSQKSFFSCLSRHVRPLANLATAPLQPVLPGRDRNRLRPPWTCAEASVVFRPHQPSAFLLKGGEDRAVLKHKTSSVTPEGSSP